MSVPPSARLWPYALLPLAHFDLEWLTAGRDVTVQP